MRLRVARKVLSGEMRAMLAAPRTIMVWRGRIRYRPATVFAALVRYYGGLIPATWIDDDFRRYRGPRPSM